VLKPSETIALPIGELLAALIRPPARARVGVEVLLGSQHPKVDPATRASLLVDASQRFLTGLNA
jgi:hypothetical protein